MPEPETGGQPTNAEFEHYGSDWRPGPLSVSERIYLLEEALGAAVLAIKSLENRLLAVERATPWTAPPKPRPPKLPPRR